jgi:hypothetical protein
MQWRRRNRENFTLDSSMLKPISERTEDDLVIFFYKNGRTSLLQRYYVHTLAVH